MSGEKVPYHLRQNKYVDRELFVEILAYVNRVRPIKHYLYVSFGGAYLEDFKVIHSNFGIDHMLSLEEEMWVYRRQQFNVPYGCVTCRNITADSFIKDFQEVVGSFGERNTIVWLDYASPDKIREQLSEYEALISKIKAYDVVKITLNANPATLGGRGDEAEGESLTGEQLRERRLLQLRSRINDYLPADVREAQLSKSSYPLLLLHAVRLAVSNAMAGTKHYTLHPISAYTYQDTHQMLTVTAVMLPNQEVAEFLTKTGLRDYEFAISDWSRIIDIDVPYLSAREKLYLDTVLYRDTTKSDRSRLRKEKRLAITLGTSEAETRSRAERYIKFYRYYPHYHRIHY